MAQTVSLWKCPSCGHTEKMKLDVQPVAVAHETEPGSVTSKVHQMKRIDKGAKK